MTMRPDQIRQAALEVAETAIHGAAARRWLRIDGVDLTEEDEVMLKAELRGVAEEVAKLGAPARGPLCNAVHGNGGWLCDLPPHEVHQRTTGNGTTVTWGDSRG